MQRLNQRDRLVGQVTPIMILTASVGGSAKLSSNLLQLGREIINNGMMHLVSMRDAARICGCGVRP